MTRTAAALALALGASAAAAEVPAGYVEERLANGMLVSVLADGAHPVVAIRLWIRAGSAADPPGASGLAHLVEHLTFGGTATHPRGAYEALVHRAGGFDNAFTGPDQTVYAADLPPGAHLELLALEADRMRNLAVTAENLANEQRIVLEELRLRAEGDPLARAFAAAQRALLGGHPYGRDTVGARAEVEAASLETVAAFRSAHYRPEQAHLVVVGPVDAGEVLAVARAEFGPWPPGGAPLPPVPALADWTFPREVRLREDLPPVEIAVVGAPLPPADAADAAAVDVLLELLAGAGTDRFREEIVVRRGRALEAGTQAIRLRHGGALAFWAASLPYRRVATAWRDAEAVVAALARLDWATDEEVAAARRGLRRRILEADWRAAARADAIGRAVAWQGDSARAFDRVERIEAVTRADVEAASHRYLGSRPLLRVHLRPERVPWYVRAFGWLVPLVDKR